MPHLAALTGRVGESTNLLVLAGDQVRFIGSVEGTQALRVGNREGMVFPAHRHLRRGPAAGGPAGRRSSMRSTPTSGGSTASTSGPT